MITKRIRIFIIAIFVISMFSRLNAQCVFTISEGSPYLEDFSNWTANTSYNRSGIMPDCWGGNPYGRYYIEPRLHAARVQRDAVPEREQRQCAAADLWVFR